MKLCFIASLGFTVMAMVSCSGPKGPFQDIKAWDFNDMGCSMVFCTAAADQDEAAVRSGAERIAGEKLQSFRRVDVVVLYDAAHAKEISSKKAVENMMQGGGTSPNALLYGGKIEGGGYLSAAQGDESRKWTFVPRRDTEASAKDRAFTK